MLCDWQMQLIDEAVTRASAKLPTTAGRLFDCMPAEPQFFQQEIIRDCTAAARGVGLRLPKIRIVWRAGRADVTAAAIRVEDRECYIALSVYQSPSDLARAMFHELAHAHDFLSGVRRTREELEVRAEDFARRMMQQWLNR